MASVAVDLKVQVSAATAGTATQPVTGGWRAHIRTASIGIDVLQAAPVDHCIRDTVKVCGVACVRRRENIEVTGFPCTRACILLS